MKKLILVILLMLMGVADAAIDSVAGNTIVLTVHLPQTAWLGFSVTVSSFLFNNSGLAPLLTALIMASSISLSLIRFFSYFSVFLIALRIT